MKTFAHDPFVKIAHKSLAYILVFCIVNMPVWALDWSSGTNASFNGSDTVTVDALRSIGVWNNFDTAPGQLLQFLAGGDALTADHAVLNKVINGNITQFDGILQGGQGHILLINPAGIMIGSTATINAGRFTASTMHLQMSDTDFLAGATNFEFAKGSDDPAAQISLLAGSSVTAERVDLLAQQINNAGTITTETGGIVVMAAGDRVLLGEAGSDVIVEMTGIENGMVTNDGTIKAPEGTIVMAAGDIFSTSLGMKVFNGAGKIVQNGTLDVNAENATAVTGNGGTIQLLAGEDVTLAAGSVTTANAIPDEGTNRYDGGDIIIESTETVNISLGALLYAKGNGWDDVDENFRFDFDVDTSFSGSIQIFGKNLNLPAPDVFASQIDLLGYNVGPLQQLQSGVLTLGNNEGNMIVAEGPLPGTSADNTIYEEWIEGLSIAGVHIDTLSSGNITFNDLNPGDTKDLGLIGGAGNMSFRTRFDTGGIIVSDLTDIIGTTDGGDIFMVAGSGGITTGAIGITNEDKTGDPGQIILATANGGDIETLGLFVESGNREIVSISSSGDVLIDGGVHVATNEVPDSIDKTATADICIDAGDDITINGPVEADAHGKVEMFTSIHIDAGLDPESNDESEDQAGIININLGKGQIIAISEESGPAPGDAKDLVSEATIEIHTSAVGDDAITITGGGGGGAQIQVRAKVQGKPPLGDSMPGNDPTNYYAEEITQDGDIEKTQIVKVEIRSSVDYDDKEEYPDCDGCVTPPFLPPTPEFFLVKNDAATVDWRAGYTIIGDGSYDAADLDVLLNDNGPDIPLYDAVIIIDSLVTEKGGTLEWVEFQYTDGDGVTHIYDGFVYTPPSYTEDFEWDGVSDYATFTDSFQYQGYKQESDSLSLNTATVTLSVQNEVPTLAGDSDTIHMNTSSDFDLSTLVTDNDGTPGELTGEFTGTYGDLSYEIVEGLIPVSDGGLPTDGTLSLTGPTITYTPLDGYVSPAGEPTTFGYTVTDDNITDAVFELPDGEDLDVTVTNTAPTFAGDLGDVHMNTTVTGIDLLGPAYAFDADGDPLSVIVNGQIATVSDFLEGNNVTAAELEYQGNDSWTYTPADGYTGGESFTVTLWDGEYDYSGGTKGDMVLPEDGSGSLLVNMTNTAPTFAGDLGDVHMNTTVTGIDLLDPAYAFDADGDPLSVIVNGQIATVSDFLEGNNVTAAELEYQGNDSWTYTPADGYTGGESFTVTLWDGEYDYSGGTKGDMVLPEDGSGSLLVNMTNTAPTFAGDLGDVHMNTTVTGIDLLDPAYAFDADGDPLSVIVNGQIATVSDFLEGNNVTAAELEYQGNDSWTYTPADGYTGGESFTVTLWDGEYDYSGGTKGDMVLPEDGSGSLLVNMTNTAPTFAGDLGDVHMNTTVTGIDLLDPAYAFDADGDPLSVIVNGQIATVSDFLEGNNVTAAELEYQGNDSWTYTPADGYTGGESFTVTLWDGEYDYSGGTKGDMVLPEDGSGSLLVNMTNTAPTFAGDLGDVHMNTTVTGIDLLDPAYAFDADGDPLSVIVNGQIATVSDFLEGNNVTAAELEYQGNDSWTYTPADGYTGGESFTVTLWDGEYDYSGGTKGDMVLPEDGSGSLLVNMTNTAPTFAGDLGDVHMNTTVTGIDLLDPAYAFDADGDPLSVIVNGQIATVSDFLEGNNVTAAELEYQGNDSWTYTPADGYTGGESFTVTLWDGEYDYSGGTKGDMVLPEDGSGSLLVNMTNTAPTFAGDLGDVHMNTTVTGIDLLDPAYAFDADGDPLSVIVNGQIATVSDFLEGNNVTAAELEYQGNDSWTYTPADGYTGGESFTVTLWDGEYDYSGGTKGDMVLPEDGSGSLLVNMTNILPSATGDLGSTPAGTPITAGQNGVVSPVLVIDFPDLPQQTTPDTLSIPDGIYTGSGGGTLVYVNGQWTYTPAPGFSGKETFEIDVWDGENIYNGSSLAGPAYGQGTVTVTVATTPPPTPTPTPTPDPVLELAPVAPLADYEIPKLVGCPAEMEAAANELATNSDQLQLLITNAMATNPNLQPCDACASLLTAATVLKQMDNQHVAALAQIFNSQAPIDAPFTPEVSASVVTAFANFREMETELAIMTAEQYEQYQQYALADELVEAFVSYVAVLENDLKLPVGDAMALVMDKYGEAIEAIGNPNISVYLIEQMEATRVAGEFIIASAD